MANYSVNMTDNGDGTYTAAAFRAPATPASGGTSLPGGGSDTLASDIYDLHAVFAHVMVVILNDKSTNG